SGKRAGTGFRSRGPFCLKLGKARSTALRRAGPLGHFPMQLLDDGRGTRLKQSWENGMHQGCQARTEEQQRKPQRNGRVSKVVLVHRARVDNEKTLECRPHRQNFLTLSCSVLSWSLSPHLACSDMASPDTLGLGGRDLHVALQRPCL